MGDISGGKVNLAGRDIYKAGHDQVFNPTFNITPSAEALAALVRGTLAKRRIWNIPTPVRTFTGREEDLAALHEALSGSSDDITAIVPAAALHGMGGVGKSQLALAYAARHKREYRLGWWIAAETEAGITTGLATLAAELGLQGNPGELVRMVVGSLPDDEPWLLIFDNATGPGALEPYLGTQGRGSILVTSRNPAWPGLTPLPVDLLPLEDAIKLLLRISGTKDREAARALAIELDRLPLALEQAGAYARWLSCSLDDYLRLFRDRKLELLGERAPDPNDHRATVETTFSLAMSQLSERDPLAATILEMFAFLGPEDLEREFFVAALAAGLNEDELDVRRALANLVSAGLATASGTSAIRVHRLVSEVVRGHLDADRQRERLSALLGLLRDATPDTEDPATWPTAHMLLPHILALRSWPATDTDDLEAFESSLSWAGIYLLRIALHQELSRDLFTQALAIERQLHDGDHAHVATSLSHLALDLRETGQTGRARELGQEALAMRRRLYPGDHRDVAASLTNLANDLFTAGEIERALELGQEGLAMRRRLYPGDHRDVAASLCNVAIALRAAGEAERARELHEEALAMVRRLYAGDHPDLATCMGDLAADLSTLGEIERVRELDEEALAMRRRLYIGDHPHLAMSLSNLADDLSDAGETDRARALHEEALAMFRRLYTGDHPDLATSLINSGIDLRDAGETERARALHKEALAMFRRLFTGDHPDIAWGLGALAIDLRAAGETERALELDEEALAMYRRLYPGDHPAVATSLINIGIDLRAASETERARERDEEALAVFRRFGDRRGISTGLSYLAIDLRAAGEFERARQADEEAMEVLRAGRVGDDPDVAARLTGLANDLRAGRETQLAQMLKEEAARMRERLGARGSAPATDEPNAP